MDRELLRSQAAARRNHVEVDAEPLKKKLVWTCEYCSHGFQHERVFMNHQCKEKAKIDELRSGVGLAAYAYWTEWLKLRFKKKAPPIENFAESSQYTTFIKFATWAKRVRLPNPSQYIHAMVNNGNVQPSLWCRDNVYAMYLQGYDAIVSPEQQFVQSLDEIASLMFELKSPSDLYTAIGIDTLIDLVFKRKISPWFLIASTKFREWWQGLPQDEATRIEDTLQIGALMIRISRSEKLKKLLADFSAATKELEL